MARTVGLALVPCELGRDFCFVGEEFGVQVKRRTSSSRWCPPHLHGGQVAPVGAFLQ